MPTRNIHTTRPADCQGARGTRGSRVSTAINTVSAVSYTPSQSSALPKRSRTMPLGTKQRMGATSPPHTPPCPRKRRECCPCNHLPLSAHSVKCWGLGGAFEVSGHREEQRRQRESPWRALKQVTLFCIELYFLCCYSASSWLHKY